MLEQHLESQTMLQRWDLSRPRTSKNGKCSRPDCQMDDMDDSDGGFRHPCCKGHIGSVHLIVLNNACIWQLCFNKILFNIININDIQIVTNKLK